MVGKIGIIGLLLWAWMSLYCVSYEFIWLADVRRSVIDYQMSSFWYPVRVVFFFSIFCLLAAVSQAVMKTILKSTKEN